MFTLLDSKAALVYLHRMENITAKEKQAVRLNAYEWASSLSENEIEHLLMDGRNDGTALSKIERNALVIESRNRSAHTKNK